MYYVIFGLLGAALLGADQWVKAWVVGHLQMGETTSLFPGFLELMRVHNYGAAWSSFAGQKWLLLGVTGVILAAVLWVLARRIVRHPLGICACCLILSGPRPITCPSRTMTQPTGTSPHSAASRARARAWRI